MVRYLVGKAFFQSKDKSQTFYKITVLESLTARQYQSGQRGYNASDYFVDVAVYSQLPDNLDAMPRVDLGFDVVGGKAYLNSVQIVQEAQEGQAKNADQAAKNRR